MSKKAAPPQKTYPPKTPASHDLRITRPHGSDAKVARGSENQVRAAFGLSSRKKGC